MRRSSMFSIQLEYARVSPLGDNQIRLIIFNDELQNEYEVVDIIESDDIGVLKEFLIEHHVEDFNDLILTWDLAVTNIREGI